MKGAMWALGIFALGIFGIVLINLFGNITVTNQQNYTMMKNSVEAAMYDSIDIAHYRNGFCLCTDKVKTNDKWVFDSSDEYTIVDAINQSCQDVTSSNSCNYISGEVKINEEVFAESLIRRFAETTKGNRNYQITIQDIIEYPPKVSVRIKSYDAYNLFSVTSATFEDEDFNISNQIDAIIENS